MEVIEDKAVLLAIPEHLTPHITECIDRSEVISTRDGLSELLVYWGIDEMLTLNKLIKFKENLPSPMARDYSWPGMFTPFDHQRITAEFRNICN